MAGSPELSDQEFRVWTVAALSAGETGLLWKALETIAGEAAAATRTTAG